MATSSLALIVIALLSGLGAFSALMALRWGVARWVAALTAREHLRQEQLKTSILEEQLRNEALRDLTRPR
ncbi:MAG: hypothetical protein ABMA64_17075 [Myxococcota bacterium]